MLSNYLKIALRSLFKNKVYSVITISGLAIGLTGFILIGIYVRKETSYDKRFAKSGSMYRLNTKVEVNGIQNSYSSAHFPAAYDMVEEYPEVTHALTLYDPIPFQGVVPRITVGDNTFSERNFLFTDSSFFTFIDLKPAFFLIAVGTVILISWLTLAFQMIRASRVNPAVVLKSEG